MYQIAGKVIYHFSNGSEQHSQFCQLAARGMWQNAKNIMVDLGAGSFEIIKY